MRRRQRVHGKDLHIRFSERLYQDLEELANDRGVPLTTGVRLMVERGIAADAGRPVGDAGAELFRMLRNLHQLALAILIAVEQNQLFLAGFSHSGDAKMAALVDEAGRRALRRLIEVERSVAEEGL